MTTVNPLPTTPLPRPAPARSGNPPTAVADRRQLARLRWGVRAVLTLGVTASIAANVLHARPNPVSQIIAAWPPLALLLTVELISRVPVDRRGLAAARLIATTGIAGIAAWVSYWHMAGVAARYGETDAAASFLLPISVDGLVIVASVSLVEIAGRIRAFATSTDPTPAQPAPQATTYPPDPGPPLIAAAAAPPRQAAVASQPVPVVPPPQYVEEGRGDQQANDNAAVPPPADPLAATPPDAQPDGGDDQRRATGLDSDDQPGNASGPTPTWPDAMGDLAAEEPRQADPDNERPTTPPSTDTDTDIDTDTRAADTAAGPGDTHGDHHVDEEAVPAETAAAVAYWYRKDPSLHPAEIGARIGRSERTVRRYWPPAPTRAVNGHDARDLAEGLGAR